MTTRTRTETHNPARHRSPQRCPQLARRGTGLGVCDRPLDARGQCDRAAEHVNETDEVPPR